MLNDIVCTIIGRIHSSCTASEGSALRSMRRPAKWTSSCLPQNIAWEIGVHRSFWAGFCLRTSCWWWISRQWSFSSLFAWTSPCCPSLSPSPLRIAIFMRRPLISRFHFNRIVQMFTISHTAILSTKAALTILANSSCSILGRAVQLQCDIYEFAPPLFSSHGLHSMGYKYLIVIMGKKQSKKDGEYRVRDILDFK